MNNDTMDKNKSVYKLDGFPAIYYNNLDDDVAKREYMESQFSYWEITNYHRTSGYDGRKSDLSEILVGKYPNQMHSKDVGSATSHMKSIKTWLENSDESEKTMVVMEDDCDLNTVKHWPFVWRDFTSKLPPDWDIVQLAVINPVSITIKIHKTYVCDYSSACYMISRHYAKKLVSIYCRGEKYKLDYDTIKPRCCSEHMKYQGGKSLSIPLFMYNENFESSIHPPDHIQTFHMPSHDSLWNFWRNEAVNTNWNDMFTFDPMNHQGVPLEAQEYHKPS
jgi:hypothetical protein